LSGLQDQSLTTIFTQLKTKEIAIHAQALIAKVETDVDQLTAYVAILLFRRLIILHLRVENVDIQGTITPCFNITVEVLALLREHLPDKFEEAKLAIVQAFCLLYPSLNHSHLESSRFLDGVSCQARSLL